MLVQIKKSEGLREYEVPVASDAMAKNGLSQFAFARYR